MSTDEHFMQRALDLAALGSTEARPNPIVGCVIAHEGRIIGEGWHQKFGSAHAEVNAVNSITDKQLLPESTVYVTLEPCSHFGKTPPCANLLIREKVKRVVICNTDPNPVVSGRGIKKLQDAGIDVEQGILEQQGRYLNRRFFTFQEKKRPYILLKWAQTADGFIARPDYSSKWISGDVSRTLVHKWRTEEQSILVGTNTALHDNPQLNARQWSGPQPLRLVIDRQLRLPVHLNLFDGSQTTWVYSQLAQESRSNLEFIQLSADSTSFITAMLQDLFEKQIQSVLVEGGNALLQTFIAAGLWEEARIFTGQTKFGEGIPAPSIGQGFSKEILKVGEDELEVLLNL